MKAYIATVLLLIALFSCTKKVYLHRINTYLNAHTIKTKRSGKRSIYRKIKILIIKNGFNRPLTGFRKTGRQNWMKYIKKESLCKPLKQQKNGLPYYNFGEKKLRQ